MTTTIRTMSDVAMGPQVNIAGGTVPLYTRAQTGPDKDEKDEIRSNTQYVDLRVSPRAAVVQEIVEYLKALYK